MKKTILLIIIVLIISCIKQHQKSDKLLQNLIHFAPPETVDNKVVKRYNISQSYSTVNGFELDRNGGAIGTVNKVEIYNNFLIILDSRYAKKVFVYDLKNSGKFMFSIGDKGKGPGEFLHISDFTIDSSNNELLITDSPQKKIVYFDFKGNFKKEIKLSFNPMKIFCFNDYLYFMCYVKMNGDRGIKVTDKNTKLLKEYFPYENYPLSINYNTAFFTVENKLLLNYPNSDTIFQFKGAVIEPYLVLESGKNSFLSYIKKNDLDNISMGSFLVPGSTKRNTDFDNIIIPQSYFEDNKIRLFRFIKNDRMGYIFQSKIQNNNEPSFGYLRDDILGVPVNLSSYNDVYGTISILTSQQLESVDIALIENNLDKISKRLVLDIKDADIDCNPFIIFYK